MYEKGTGMIRTGLLLVALLVGVPASPGWAAPPETSVSSAAVHARSAEPTNVSNGERRCFGKRATIVGTRGADRIRGTKRDDVIWAGAGDDVIKGLHRRDIVCAGPGDDLVRDVRGAVKIHGGTGNDRIVAEVAWQMRGGGGADELVITDASASLRGGPGPDLLSARGRARERRYTGFGLGGPCLDYTRARRGVLVDLANGYARGQGLDRIVGLRCARTSRYGDVVIGTARGDDLYTRGGRDRIHARGGHDFVQAGPGADLLELGAGNDRADGDGGADRMYGRAGDDFLVGFNASDYISGGKGDDRVHAGLFCDPGSSYGLGVLDTAPNTLLGGPGNDYLTGDLGDDYLHGGPGFDRGTGGAEGNGVDVIISVEKRTDC
jgi:Ca2+-binding RTX toxin-like protein